MKKVLFAVIIMIMSVGCAGCGSDSESPTANFADVSVTLPSDSDWKDVSEDDDTLECSSEKYGKITISYEDETKGFTVGELLQPYTTNDYKFKELELNGYDAAYNILEQGYMKHIHAQMLIDTKKGYYYDIYYISADGMDNSEAWDVAEELMNGVTVKK